MRKIILFLTFFLGAIQLYAQGCVASVALTTFETVNPVVHQASGTVVASTNYGVNSGYNATLRAGVLIELKANTYIRPGSLFLAKIGECTKSVARESDLSDEFTEMPELRAYPNPVESTLNLSVNNLKMSKITLTTLDGRIVTTLDAKDETSMELEFGSYSSGIYLLTVETSDGKIFQDKIVKD